MTKNTGGSAFPGGLFETVSCGQNDRMPYNDGMTLLDYFAAGSMKGLLSDHSTRKSIHEYAQQNYRTFAEEVCEQSYGMAKQMLVTREKYLK